MQKKNHAFDDFVDECFLQDDLLCTYVDNELDKFIEELTFANFEKPVLAE